MTPELGTTLRRENPWLEHPERFPPAHRLPAPFVQRRQPGVAALEARGLPRDRATLLTGPRQCGKSSFVWNALSALPPRVLFVDCELSLLRRWCTDPGAFLADLGEVVPEPAAIFLDEIQHLEDAGLFVKGLVDRGLPCPLVVTGSSSYHLGARIRESLAGRARRARLLPFGLDEVCEANPAGPAIRRAARLGRLARHIVLGGYPRVWLGDDPQGELAELVEAFVIRDASDRFRIERPDVFRALLMLAARQVGSPVNLSEWASLVGASTPTVASYLGIMEESHIVARVPLFAGGLRAELTKSQKLYFVDTGLRNYLVSDFSPFERRADRGALLECWLFAELYKALPFATALMWWRTRSGAEVDFVLREGTHLVGVEVKASVMTRPQLSRSARSFIQAYAPGRFLVANLGYEHTARVEGCAVEWLHAVDVPLRLREILGAPV